MASDALSTELLGPLGEPGHLLGSQVTSVRHTTRITNVKTCRVFAIEKMNYLFVQSMEQRSDKSDY